MSRTKLHTLRRITATWGVLLLLALFLRLGMKTTLPVHGAAAGQVGPLSILSISPTEVMATAVAGEVVTRTFTIRNSGGVTLTFEINESPAVLPGGFVGGALGRKGPQGETGFTNLGSTAPRWNPQHRTVRQVATTTPRILLYTDDFFTGPGATYPEQALQHLGLPFTAYYADPDGFLRALHGQGPWDLVLVSHNERLAAGAIWPHLERFVAEGGRVIVETFDIDGSHSDPTELWRLCGVQPAGDLGNAPPVFVWLPEHSLFSQPVHVPAQLAPQDLYLDDGDRLRVLDGAEALAGFSPQPAAEQAAIVLGADGRCLINSFIISTDVEDANADGLLDGVALWINELSLMARRWIDVPWLRPAPRRGALAPGDDAEVTLFFDAATLQPGEYHGHLIVRTGSPAMATGVPVTLRVERTPDMSRVTGLVIDAATGERLHAHVRAFDTPYVVETSPESGWYNLWLKPGRYTLEASAEGYYPVQQEVEVTPNDVISVGFLLRRQGVYLLPLFRNWP